ncbi:hypothetical protein FJU30_21575 [Affinibrenneria salicis]|uniref:Cysteine-rich CPCC domain-containing protein n=1 Tax=Affinibrenneria salicis TaxID=2590031 RepID=A0A5J5FT27_9GAMM|nr:CPCC family cysteine-rich protein [Affinibrenneria salicis]KAA8996385.1 hypothetical protein FJU30_21575 [Affinibrenneria salicis]
MADDDYPCPCCGARVFAELGEYFICPDCNWEDDPLQSREPAYAGGANRMSLNEARDAFRQGKPVV